MPASDTVGRALSLIQSDKSKILGLTIGKHTIATPGQHVPKADAQAAPELSFATDPSNTYMVIGLDLDAPFPSFSVLGPIVHWIQPGLKADASGSGKLTSSEPFIVNYAGPGPPPPSSPHRYVFLLYEQPPSLDISKHAPANGKEVGVMPRMRYNLAAFEKKVGLGPVVAANYFCSN